MPRGWLRLPATTRMPPSWTTPSEQTRPDHSIQPIFPWHQWTREIWCSFTMCDRAHRICRWLPNSAPICPQPMAASRPRHRLQTPPSAAPPPMAQPFKYAAPAFQSHHSVQKPSSVSKPRRIERWPPRTIPYHTVRTNPLAEMFLSRVRSGNLWWIADATMMRSKGSPCGRSKSTASEAISEVIVKSG